MTGARWTTVHYKGNAPATTDLLGGQVDFNFDQVSVSLPFIKEGKVRGLAVSTAERVPSLPDVPTFAEAGVPLLASTFTGMVAPKGTPADITSKLSQVLVKIRSEEHTSELQSLMRISYAVFCLKKKKNYTRHPEQTQTTR